MELTELPPQVHTRWVRESYMFLLHGSKGTDRGFTSISTVRLEAQSDRSRCETRRSLVPELVVVKHHSLPSIEHVSVSHQRS